MSDELETNCPFCGQDIWFDPEEEITICEHCGQDLDVSGLLLDFEDPD